MSGATNEGGDGVPSQLQMQLAFFGEICRMKELLLDIRHELSLQRKLSLMPPIDAGRHADPRRLLKYAFQVNSQNGEDGIISEIFRRIGTKTKTFVEIGAGNGIECNTAFLLSQGWSGFWIDGEPSYATTLHGRSDLIGAVKTAQAILTRQNTASVLQAMGVPESFDLVSIDIDQNTYYIWEALGTAFHPRVAVIEYNGNVPPYVDWKVSFQGDKEWDRSQNFGASLKALELLGARLGYVLVGCDENGINAFFVRKEYEGLFCAPFTAENHYERPRIPGLIKHGHNNAVLERDPKTKEG